MSVDSGMDQTSNVTPSTTASRRRYIVSLGKLPLPRKHCSYFKGKGDAAFEQDKMFLNAVRSKPALAITFIIWGCTALTVSIILYIQTGLILILLVPNPILFSVIYAIVKLARRKWVTSGLKYNACTAHFWPTRDFILIKTADEMWVDLTPDEDELEPFVEDVKRYFGKNFFEEDSSDDAKRLFCFEEPYRTESDVLSTTCDVVRKTCKVSDENVGEDYALGLELGGDTPEAVKLRFALERRFGLVLNPDEVSDIRTVGQLAEHIEKMLNPEFGE